MGQENRGPGARFQDSYFFKRREEKYEMHVGAAAFLRHEIERHLPLFEFRKGHPYTYISTIYFDTSKLEFYRKALDSYDDNLKIRVKEYYYQNNTVPRNGLLQEAAGPWITFDACYLEIKKRIRGLVVKQRFEVPKHLLGRLLRGDDIWHELVEAKTGIEFDGVRDTYQEFRRYIQHYQLLPKSIINYRRGVYQQDEQELRITFDDEIAVFPPVPGLYEGISNLTREGLGIPREVFEKVILEIKCQDGYPDWLIRTLRTHQPKRISKFTSSLRVLTSGLPCPESEESKTFLLPVDNENGDTKQVSGIQR
jgi:hypothetical protein